MSTHVAMPEVGIDMSITQSLHILLQWLTRDHWIWYKCKWNANM